MSAEQKPHLVVGIDFGMTCTGVAYTNLSIGSETIRWVQKWPGRFQANENKVPSVLVYPENSAEPSSWGFLCETVAEQTAPDRVYKEWFKTCLTEEKLQQKQREDPDSAPKDMKEVENLYEDFLRRLYDYLAFKLGGEISVDWHTAIVEFIFSVPTTWAPVPTVELFKSIIRRSGFGQHPGHSIMIGLTEAEAAAVHISTEAPGIFHEGDVLIVCDCGGGTTDLSVLRVQNNVNQAIQLQQLDVVFGDNIGSAAIDFAFEMMVTSRLSQAHTTTQPLPNIEPEEAAWEMVRSRDFQSVKCGMGSPDDTPLFSIAIPKVPHTYSHPDPEVRIKNGEMTFSREDLQKPFDKQIGLLFGLIDRQLERLYLKYPTDQVAHLVLSGGLGNSSWVQQKLKNRFLTSPLPNARSMRVRIAPDPQLAVCKGLVADRVRRILTSHSVLGWRCCRSSYGTLCKIEVNAANLDHINKQVVRDPLNGKLYIVDAIAWFVRKGEAVSVDQPIIHSFVKKIRPGDPRRAFPTTVVQSNADRLPDQMNQETTILCEIQSKFSPADERKFQEKNKRFWSFGKHYMRVEYIVKVLIGPADIRFELWFDNQKLSQDHSITVDWEPTPTPDMSIYNRVELPDSRPSQLANPLAGLKKQQTDAGEQSMEKKRPGKFHGGFISSMARSTKWTR